MLGRVEIFTTVAAAQSQAKSKPRVLVPTMGALHKAHGELTKVARERAGADGEVAVGIFLDPLQFGTGSGFGRYPRPGKTDEEFFRDSGVGLFFPAPLGGRYFV